MTPSHCVPSHLVQKLLLDDFTNINVLAEIFEVSEGMVTCSHRELPLIILIERYCTSIILFPSAEIHRAFMEIDAHPLVSNVK